VGRDGSSGAPGISLAVNIAVPFVVLALEVDVAGTTTKAVEVEFLGIAGPRTSAFVCLKVFAFDTFVTSSANRAVAFVVVLGAVGSVLEHVKVVCFEGEAALEADEAGAVIAACQAAVSGGDGLANDHLAAATAWPTWLGLLWAGCGFCSSSR
jgi:hypothetical protein